MVQQNCFLGYDIRRCFMVNQDTFVLNPTAENI